MTKVDDSTYIVRLPRKIQFAGMAGTAVIAIPNTLKQINGLSRGDFVEFIYDMRKPDECRVVFRKAGVGGDKVVGKG